MVPRHIVRLDGKKRLHGWQVRFDKPHKFFSDYRHGSADKALDAAKAYLRRTWHAEPIQTTRGYDRRKQAKTTGVRIVRQFRGGKTVWYAETHHPRLKKVRRFYIGVDGTKTRKRIEQARARALKQRETWLKECPLRLR
jgi:hypothetical protein